MNVHKFNKFCTKYKFNRCIMNLYDHKFMIDLYYLNQEGTLKTTLL